MENRAKKYLALSTIIALITILGGILMYTTRCSVGPKDQVIETAPPPVTCDDGSGVGTTRTVACPAGQTVGQDVQVCTASGWKDATNTCSLPPPPTCGKTTYADILPILKDDCTTCHAALTQYSVAQSWSAEIARRVGLPSGNNDHMPQGNAPQLNGDEIALLQKWVADGAIQDCTQASNPTFIDLNYINTAMIKDATALSSSDRPFTRYLITAHAIDAGVNATQLKVWVQAMNKALNGLNNETQDTFTIQSIEPTQSVWRIDLRAYGIGAAEAALIEDGDVNINIIDQTSQGQILQALLGTKKPWFHADNFIDVTYRNSKVYYGILNTPATLSALQQAQGVNFNDDLANLRLNFIGSASSPIAEQKNRLIVRDVESRSLDFYYWQTFDVNNIPHNINVIVNGVQVQENTKNLFQFPLLAGAGSAVTDPAVAVFTADASEVIYSLPNGMQGYALFDAVGNLLNDADPNVVIDTATPLGNKVINAGNSCGRCHNAGTIPMADQILSSISANRNQFTANDVQLVQALYKAAAADGAFFKKDNVVFGRTLSKIGVDPNQPDPMSVVTDRFLQNWNLQMVASLLFLTPDQAIAAINTSPVASAQIGALLTPNGEVTFLQLTAVLPQLIKDARLFQDSLSQ